MGSPTRSGDAVLITSDGEGHTAFLSNSDCVTDVVIAYLVDLVVPGGRVVLRRR